MPALKTAVTITWVLFWLYWLLAALGAKERAAGRRRLPVFGLSVLLVAVLLRAFRHSSLTVHSVTLGVLGTIVLALGLALAVWARAYLGRNWGMPMTEKAEPELVTSGPYRFVRHPIYTGLVLGLLGTALVTSLIGIAMAAVAGAYFYYSATVEERNLAATFPATYPAYRESTKMLIPFVL